MVTRTTKAQISGVVFLVVSATIALVSFATPIPENVYIPTLAGIIAVLISFVYWELGTTLDKIIREFGNDLDEIQESIKSFSQVRPIREPDFYNEFQADVEEAGTRVWISYFDTKNPLKTTDDEKKQYYQDIGETIAEMSPKGVEFRRMVRTHPEIDPWVEEMVENMKGVSRFSIACYPDDNPGDRERPYIPVQLIDDEFTYFVAVGEQEQSVEPRDLKVQSLELNDQWSRYYNRMWNDSYVIFRRGSIDTDEYKRYREHLKNIEQDE